MATDDIHKPTLPGVRTMHRDMSDAKPETEIIDGVEFSAVRPQKEKQKIPVAKIPYIGAPAETPSVRGDTSGVFDVSHAFDTGTEGGMIVSDKKGAKWSFWGALTGGMKKWGKEKAVVVENFDPFKVPEKPKIAPASNRIDVIKKATAKSAHVPTDDHALLVEKLRSQIHVEPNPDGMPV